MPSEHECNQLCCHRQSSTHVEIQAYLKHRILTHCSSAMYFHVANLLVRLIGIPCARCACQYYQAFLKYAVSIQGTLDKHPKIPGPVLQFLCAEHFMMNDNMLELVTPVADLIGYLEKAETNLADIVVQFLTLQVHFDIMEAKCYIHNKFIMLL